MSDSEHLDLTKKKFQQYSKCTTHFAQLLSIVYNYWYKNSPTNEMQTFRYFHIIAFMQNTLWLTAFKKKKKKKKGKDKEEKKKEKSFLLTSSNSFQYWWPEIH